MRSDTIPARLMNQATLRPNDPAYYIKRDGSWQETSWKDYVAEVRSAAKALIALGFKPGDKVAMLGFNRPEWVIFHLAAMSAGGAGVGIYSTCSAEEVQYIADHAEVEFVLVEHRQQWEKLAIQREHLPRLKHVVMMRNGESIDDPIVLSWDEFNKQANNIDDSDLDGRIDQLDLSSLATLIYTSGTTGPPKGVMLSHENLAWTANVLIGLVDLTSYDFGVSYLPLSHIAEQMMTIHGPTTAGSTIYYAESIESVAENLREVQPTVIFGVPRIWEKFHAAVASKLGAVTGGKKRLIDWSRGVGTGVSTRRNLGKSLGIGLDLKYRIATYLVFKKLKTALGLSNARVLVSGAAPIAKEILEFFASLDLVIREVYGQSEDCGPTSFNAPGNTKFGTVGTAIPGLDIKLASDGEILVKGPNVFMGYYKDQAATDGTIVDGWMHSGDLGELDSDGFLTITGRKKDIIITAGGKNITPKNIELALKEDPLVSEAVVIGDRRKFLSALLTLDPDAVGEVCAGCGADAGGDLDQVAELRSRVQALVDSVNSHLARVETIKKFTILSNNFSIERGELTPTLKIKRRVINELYAEQIEAMYRD